ncbi:MAG: elongation factor Ts [Proteobacteria bacterium]|nr:elongation factor Ts [Pseudomonadota bacterium]
MTEITAAQVKELRQETGVGMMDCKKALLETGGELDDAVDWLRKNGLAAAARKVGRVAADGLIGLAVEGRAGAVVEVNAETDFVARNEAFQEFVKTVAALALESGAGTPEDLRGVAYPDSGRTAGEQLTHLITTLGENMILRRVRLCRADSGVLASYVHNTLAPGLGRIGVLVAVDTSADGEKLETLAKQLAMHVAAANPQTVSSADLDAAALERERSILGDQARASGKPDDIVEKIIEGRLRKFYEEVCLLDQIFVIDGETKVAKVLEAAGKELGSPITIKEFTRLALGEGVEKPDEDFAAEVAAAAGG